MALRDAHEPRCHGATIATGYGVAREQSSAYASPRAAERRPEGDAAALARARAEL